MNFTQEVAGRFRLETSGGERGYIDHGWNDNLILNAGLDYLLSSAAGMGYGYMSVGASSAAVSPTQTALLSRIATTARQASYSYGYNDEGGFGWTRVSVQFDQGAAAGNVSEVGAGWNASGSLFSRALILDGAGLPTSLTILADEFLTVTYELRRWWIDPVPVEIKYLDEGVEKTTLVEAEKPISTASNSLGAAPTSGAITISGATVARGAASGGTLIFDINHALAQGNPSIASIKSGNASAGSNLIPGGAGFKFTPPIPKTNEFTVGIKCQVTFKRRGE